MVEFWLKVFTESFTLFFMLVGLFGLIVPIFPGLTVIWMAALFYGIVSGFTTLGWVLFAIITILMLVGNVIDNIMMGAKARQSGASWVSIGAGLVAGIVGSLALPPFGGLIGAPLALFLAELIRLRKARAALSSVGGLLIGLGWSFVIRFIIGLVMLGLWMIWAWA